jgi:hypothetical protein
MCRGLPRFGVPPIVCRNLTDSRPQSIAPVVITGEALLCHVTHRNYLANDDPNALSINTTSTFKVDTGWDDFKVRDHLLTPPLRL